MKTTVPDYLSIVPAEQNTPSGWGDINDYLAVDHPGYSISKFTVERNRQISSPGKISWFWLISGSCEVSLSPSDHLAECIPGDVVVLDDRHSAELRGSSEWMVMQYNHARQSQVTGIHRLDEIEDTSGGCNVSQNAFRRLQLVWDDTSTTTENPDGDNLLGCHVVYMPEEHSRTHYHPVPPAPGGKVQYEIYLVLDPAIHGIQPPANSTPGVYTYPEYGNWSRWDFTPLHPGDILAIKAGVGHRAVDVLACVIGIPGFKPGNEFYLDGEIAGSNNVDTPYNENFINH